MGNDLTGSKIDMNHPSQESFSRTFKTGSGTTQVASDAMTNSPNINNGIINSVNRRLGETCALSTDACDSTERTPSCTNQTELNHGTKNLDCIV